MTAPTPPSPRPGSAEPSSEPSAAPSTHAGDAAAAAGSEGSGRVVIVGAGDLGMRIGHRLTEVGRHVEGWKRDPSTLPPSFRATSADLTAPARLPELPADTDAVVFCPTAGGRDPSRYRAVYRDGLRAVLERADRLTGHTGRRARLVLISSTAVHGAEHGLVDESTPLHPNTPTGEVLAETEQLLRGDESVDAAVLRLAGIYGPGRRRLLDQVRGGRLGAGGSGPGGEAPSGRGTDPWQVTNRIHVDDAAAAAAAMVTAAACPSVLIGVDELPVPLGMVHDWLADQLGLPRPWPHLLPEDEPWEDVLALGRQDPLWISTPAHGKAMDGRRLHELLGTLEHPDFRSGYAPLVTEARQDD